jgi:putative Mg2+ transporter-C (MgtC) family protein
MGSVTAASNLNISDGELLLRLGLTVALCGAIGLERETRGQVAGLRTHILVGLGAALFTLVSAYAFDAGDPGVTVDPTRIAAQIVTGIGFLGAGAIIRQGLSVRGLTTAATLWVVAAIGMAAGAGYYGAAVLATALVLVSLWPLRLLAHRVFSGLRAEEGRLSVDLRSGAGAAPLLAVLEDAGARLRALDFEEENGRRRVSALVQLEPGAAPAQMVARLMDEEDVLGAEWVD